MNSISLTPIALIGFIWCNMAFAGPFGLEMGMSLKEIDPQAKEIVPGKYKTSNVPKPHSAFESYIVQIVPQTGLCYIKAVGNNISTSSYGIELNTAFYDLEKKLEKAYGKGDVTDRLFPGSIWSEPNEWMMSLLQKERILYAAWENKSGKNIKGNIKNIAMAASAINRSEGYLAVDYTFENSDACDKAISSQEDGAL